MIVNQCLSKEWINRKRGEMGNIDPALLEKSIHAFALLCALSESSLPFVFKGGSSMILLLKEFHRLSIDIDIVTLMPLAEYEPLLADIGREPPFLIAANVACHTGHTLSSFIILLSQRGAIMCFLIF